MEELFNAWHTFARDKMLDPIQKCNNSVWVFYFSPHELPPRN